MNSNRRQLSRASTNLAIELSFGEQVTVLGQLKDISTKSAFVILKSNIFMQLNDELKFLIKPSINNPDDSFGGLARISRIAVGEGIAIYFTELDKNSAARIESLTQISSGTK